MNKNDSEPVKAEFFCVSDFVRQGRGMYQIFSLKKDEPELIDEMRSVLSSIGVEWTEHDLPGVSGPEIGFMFPRAKWRIFPCDEGHVSDALAEQVHAWSGRTSPNPLPEGVFLREDCRIDVVANIKRFLASPDIIPGGFGKQCEAEWCRIMNVRTGETADTYANRKTQEHTISKDISDWVEVTYLWLSETDPQKA